MSEHDPKDRPAPDLEASVGTQEERKLRARSTPDRTLWFGLGMFGVIGWSVAIPTLLGVTLGYWCDRWRPGRFSWTLALLLAGVAVGCLNAWYWIHREHEAMENAEKDRKP